VRPVQGKTATESGVSQLAVIRRENFQASRVSRCALAALLCGAMSVQTAATPPADDMPAQSDLSAVALAAFPSDAVPVEPDWEDATSEGSPLAAAIEADDCAAIEQAAYEEFQDCGVGIVGCADGLDCGDGCSEGCLHGRPVSWISGPYLRAGFTVPIGNSYFDHQDTGYAISLGFRQALASGIAGDRAFIDLGGSYLLANGETTRTTQGLRTNFQGAQSLVTDAFDTTLTELQRGSVHAALGRYWGPPTDDPSCDPQMRLSARLGVRAGHMRGKFDERRLIDPPAFGSIVPTHRETDTFGGVFIGSDWILLERQLSFGQMRWNLDAELANDWLHLTGFDAGNLMTASVTLGFMFSR
jgi:hypothetical protein